MKKLLALLALCGTSHAFTLGTIQSVDYIDMSHDSRITRPIFALVFTTNPHQGFMVYDWHNHDLRNLRNCRAPTANEIQVLRYTYERTLRRPLLGRFDAYQVPTTFFPPDPLVNHMGRSLYNFFVQLDVHDIQVCT